MGVGSSASVEVILGIPGSIVVPSSVVVLRVVVGSSCVGVAVGGSCVGVVSSVVLSRVVVGGATVGVAVVLSVVVVSSSSLVAVGEESPVAEVTGSARRDSRGLSLSLSSCRLTAPS